MSEQTRVLYWHGFFTSSLGKNAEARHALIDNWARVLRACVAEVAAAVHFVQLCTEIDGGSAELLQALRTDGIPTSKVVSYMRGVIEVVRVAARIGVVLSCHQQAWISQSAAAASGSSGSESLSRSLEEVKAQYSVLTSTIAALPGYGGRQAGDKDAILQLALPSELFGDSRSDHGQWAHLAILNSNGADSLGSDIDGSVATRGFPGVDRVCALTLHRLDSVQADREQGSRPKPVHETAVEWQGARYFAPCANMLAHCARLRPQESTATPASAVGVGTTDQEDDAWTF